MLRRSPALALGVLLALAPAAHAQQVATVKVDASAGRHPIDDRIYGVAFAPDATTLADLNAPLHRSGGNAQTPYNWQLNADNKGADWFYESIGDASATPGERGDTFVATSRQGGAEPLLTIPTIGWVAKLAANRDKLASFSVAKYGAQQQTDQYMPDAGNGVLANGQSVTGNDPHDSQQPADETFQKGWIAHLVQTWGKAGSGGVRYYLLDNEPSIWHGSHRDVHPTGATMGEIRDKTIAYAAMIRSQDPGATILGPEEWGWSGYLYSGYDQQAGAANGYSSFPDRAANGGMDYLPWLLQQLAQHDQGTGSRSLDVFTVHYYPQGGEFGNDTSTTTQLLRNRSTRSLWDPTYKDTSWINDVVQLVPRLKGWVARYYPGLAVGLTEYNWGAEGHINGATTQADILGILGREGVDLATRWTTPDASTPTYKAMKLYRNYDGKKSSFGDTSVQAAVDNPDDLSAFASVRSSDGALTVMVVNKALTGTTQLALDVAGFQPSGNAQVFQLTAANAIDHLADLAVTTGTLATSLPAQSVTLFVVPGAAGTPVVTPSPVPSTTGTGAPTSAGTSGTGTGTSVGRGTTTGAGPAATTGTTTSAPSAASAGSGHGGCEVGRGASDARELWPLAAAVSLVLLRRRRARVTFTV